MATISGTTSVLCAFLALVAITAARSVPGEVWGTEYVIKTDSAAVTADPYVVETDSDISFGDAIEKRQTAIIPTWSCSGSFNADATSYDVVCETNLDVQSVECTLDDEDYGCGGLVFSIDTTHYVDGQEHVLLIRVSALYGNSLGTLRYTFRFLKQVTSYTVQCSSRVDGENVVITCTGTGITMIEYKINGGTFRDAQSTSQFIILGSELIEGSNRIRIKVTANGVVRRLTLTATKTAVVVFSPSYTVAYNNQGDVVFSCSYTTNGEAILIIQYSINGGALQTTTSTSQFIIDVNNLEFGVNTIVLTFTSLGGVTRTLTSTVTKTQSQTRIFSVRCGASYNDNNNADVDCETQTTDSEDIASITYTVNGGPSQTASSVTGFEVDKSLLTMEVNTIVITLISTGGLTKDLTLNLVQPLSLRCTSQTTITGVAINCISNRITSTLIITCYLNGTQQTNCDLNQNLNFDLFPQGRHLYEVVVVDANGLTVRNQISFANRLSIMCGGSLNLGANVYNVNCTSNRVLQYTCKIDGVTINCPESLVIDISGLQPGQHTLQLIGSDSYLSTATSTSLFTIPQQVGSCTIDDDAFDDVIDWTCSTNVAGVSIICLVDDIPLEPCLCQLSSEFYTVHYKDGDHTVSLILTGQDGSSKRFDQVFHIQTLISSSSQAIEPLLFECMSVPKELVVTVNCISNKLVVLTCYLDDITTPYTPCTLNDIEIAYADISQGPHTFAVVARDGDGLVDRSEVHFEEDLDISCRGSYNPGYDVVHLACDSTRPLMTTECQLDDGNTTECPTPIDIPVADFVNDLTLRVSASDSVGNTDSDVLTFLTSSCEGC